MQITHILQRSPAPFKDPHFKLQGPFRRSFHTGPEVELDPVAAVAKAHASCGHDSWVQAVTMTSCN